MRRLPSTLILCALFVLAPASARGQADARQAFQDGKALFAKGQFAPARDQFLQASRTDNRNPEVFLFLGRAHYQLGELSPAIEAWTRTLQLAPDEPYAKKMLAALRGQVTRLDDRIRLVEVLVAGKIHASATSECRRLLGEKALTDGQRAKVLTLHARGLLGSASLTEALAVAQEAFVRYAAHVDAGELALLVARIKTRMGGELSQEGISALRKIQADRAGTPAAVTAEFELIRYDLGQAVDADVVARLQKWVDGQAKHEAIQEARTRLIDARLALAAREPTPRREVKLGARDAAALNVAVDAIKAMHSTKEADALTHRLLTYISTRYAKQGAFPAAIAGTKILAAAPLPAEGRRQTLRWQAKWQGNLALRDLAELARAGKLPAGANLPKPLADTVAAWQAVNKASPAPGAWADLVELAESVRGLAAKVPWPNQPVAPKAPHQWAVAIAMDVLQSSPDPTTVQQAVASISAVVADCEKQGGKTARTIALAVHSKLLAAVPAWWADARQAAVWRRQIALLDARAGEVFDENVRQGRDADNAKPSPLQQQMLALMAKVVSQQADAGSAMLGQLRSHVTRWTARGHWALAEQLYNGLAVALPTDQKRLAELAVADLWNRQAASEHDRLLAAGLSVPRKLDPLHAKVLNRCYQLQRGLEPRDPFLARVRRVGDGIVRYYRGLEYFDIAEAALRARPADAKANPSVPAEIFGQLQLANFHYEQARRELDRMQAEYTGEEKIQLSPAFKATLADYTKFLADHPADPLAPRAINTVFSIAQIFEQHRASDVAVGIYRDFAAALAKIPAYAQAAPGGTSLAERAEYAVIGALRGKATHALGKALSARKPGQEPPAKILPEHAAAVAACKAFMKARPTSALLGTTIQQIVSIGMEYADAGSWDAAEGVFADLLQAGLPIRRPQRLEFSRGLCYVGKVMPDHARQVLKVLTTPRPGRPGQSATTALAYGGLLEDSKKRYEATGAERPAGRPAPPTKTAPKRPVTGRSPAAPADPGTPPPALEPAPDAAGESIKSDLDELYRSDVLALATIRKENERRAARVAALRDQAANVRYRGGQGEGQQAAQSQGKSREQLPAVPVLSEAELARQDKAILTAYGIFQGIRKAPASARTATADQARGEILAMIGHWRGIAQWERSAGLTERFLQDNPKDPQMPSLRLASARDYLTLAAQPVKQDPSRQAMLARVAQRFATARAKLADILKQLPEKEKAVRQEAQWDIAGSWLTQARVVNAFSATLARGQFARAAQELLGVAERYHDHPKIGTIPQMLWTISEELSGRGYFEEAITVWSDLTVQYPTNALAQQAALRIAQTYQSSLGRPLKAVEAYLELNYARGGNDAGLQNTIYQIGTKLKSEKRWVEALHVLEVFVDSFPRHANAGQALTMVGQIHQTNEAWKDAIAAYKRVVDEFSGGAWVHEAKWAIAECTINLSQWREAIAAYESYLANQAADKNKAQAASRAAEAKRRIGVLKDLARYQALIDEKGQRKAFDAQFQIAEIVAGKLSNPVKAIIEYRKVAAQWPDCHLADDAMFKIGTTFLSMNETAKARQALLAVGSKYPNSPLADDALYMVGQSYEKEALALTSVTRAGSLARNKEVAQRSAYKRAQSARQQLKDIQVDRIAQLRKGGKNEAAEIEEGRAAFQQAQYNASNTLLFAGQAQQEVQVLTATQLADRQDKMNAALRRAVEAYQGASKIAAADKAGDALLQMAVIFADRLKDPDAAMATYREIVRQFSGTSVAEDASWRIARYNEKQGKYAEAIDAYKAFLRNYRRSPKAGDAQFAVAENYEHLGKWVDAMDAYTNYINNFATGPLVAKAKEQINWIKTYRL